MEEYMGISDGHYHYLPVDDTIMKWGMYVTGAGHSLIQPGQSYPPSTHPRLYDFKWKGGRVLPEFQFILITGGRGVFESKQTGEITIEGNSLICLFPDVWHRYRPSDETGWTERWISFNGEIAHRLLGTKMIRPESAVQQLDDSHTLERIFDELLCRIEQEQEYNPVLLSMHSMGFIASALDAASSPTWPSNESQPSSETVNNPMVRDALELIWTQSHRSLTVGQIAETLGINRRTLERQFAQAHNNTIYEEINSCRLSRAQRLLRETRLPIKVISSLAGFPSQERMRTTFISHLGVPPSQYRVETENTGGL
jgi:AraC-like DNA-binding protein